MLQYYNEIFSFIQRLVKDKESAKDLTQDTYIKALEIDKKTQKDIQKAYLYKIAQNLVIDKARRNKVLTQTTYEEETHLIPKEEETESIISSENDKKRLEESIKKLSKRNRQAFVLYVYKGLSRKEIAEIMGISTNAVEKNITRATLKIKEEMKN